MNLLEGHLEESVRASPSIDGLPARFEAKGGTKMFIKGGKLIEESKASRSVIFNAVACWLFSFSHWLQEGTPTE